MRGALLSFAACVSMLAHSTHSLAETTTVEASVAAPASAAAPAATAGGKLSAYVDSRPSWTIASDEFHTENNLSLGYSFTKTTGLDLVYDFNTNINDPTQESGAVGLNPTSIDGFLKVRTGKLNLGGGLTFDHSARIYAPVETISRNAGMVSIVRNYFNFSKELSNRVKITLTELPIVHLYSQPGTVGKSGARANPIFENRVYVTTDFKISKDFALSVPVMFHVTKSRTFDGASNSDGVGYFMWVYPELTYALNDNMALAAAYYSDNLVAPDLSDSAFEKGLKAGVVQVSLQAWL